MSWEHGSAGVDKVSGPRPGQIPTQMRRCHWTASGHLGTTPLSGTGVRELVIEMQDVLSGRAVRGINPTIGSYWFRP